ncbi:MAG TPA: hypothetical protein PLQ76_06440 [bacterium]|nr:hypothetical protein [bacterium]
MSSKDSKQIKVEAYAGYKAGETPRKVILNGKAFDVEMIVFRSRHVHLDTFEEEEHFKLNLKGFGEVNVVYKPRADVWEISEPIVPKKKFSEMV